MQKYETTYQMLQPSPPLNDFIDCYWIMEHHGAVSLKERVHPTGSPQLIFHYGKPFIQIEHDGEQSVQSPSSICGLNTTFSDVIAESGSGMIGVVFHPYAMSRILSFPMSVITDISADAEYLHRPLAELQRRITDLKTNGERIKAIEVGLMNIIDASNMRMFYKIRESVRCISGRRGQMSVKKLNARMGYGERQCERLFRDHVGVSPKQFINISRLKHAVELVKTPLKLTEIAYAAGYYDQAHFTRSFKEMTGVVPGKYRKLLAVSSMTEKTVIGDR